jgi:nucleotide-binding universal stress UspA family protein
VQTTPSAQPFRVRTTAAPIVVGVDGTEGALDAVAWAAREAHRRHLPLRIVHAFAWPLLHIPKASWRSDHESALHARADRLLADAVETALTIAPGADVSTAVETDFPLPLLVAESGRSTYVVVGTGGPPALAEAFVGSLTTELAHRAKCPVVVVRRTPPPEIVDDLVVVGVDGSTLGALAVELGVEEAARRCGRLLAVHVLRHGWSLRSGRGDTSTGLRLLEESLAGARQRYPDLPIEERVVSGHAAEALVGVSGRATLLVVGAHGRAGLAELVLGSVTQTLLHRARCPVLVLCQDRVAPSRPYATAQRVGG